MKYNYNTDSHLIDLYNKSYHYHKRVLLEHENGIINYDNYRINASRKVVKHIETVANDFTGKYKLIVDNEIIGNKKGSKWYMEYFSVPSYYRARKIAYQMFIENVEK